jgi:4'-phosphopantetheinyl transferase EntD
MSISSPFARVTPPGLAVGVAAISLLQERVHEEEWRDICRAQPKRQREFVAGRNLVRALTERLQLTPQPLRRSEDRAPAWDAGRTGSLSHCHALCAAAVADSHLIQATGIDVETLGRVEPKLWATLFTETEQRFLESLEPSEQAFASTALFSAKETFYKCQFTLTQQWVGFHGVEVTLIDDDRCRITPTEGHSKIWHEPEILIEQIDSEHLVTLMWISQ